MKRYSLTDTLNFGKYKEDTIAEVIKENPTYIEWALDEIEQFELDDKAMEVYEKAIKEHYRFDDVYDYDWADGHPNDYGDR